MNDLLQEILSLLSTESITSLLKENQFLQGGAVLGAITASFSFIFYKLRALFSSLYFYIHRKFRYVMTIEEDSEMLEALTEYFNKYYSKEFRNVNVKMQGTKISTAHQQDTFYIFPSLVPIKVSKAFRELQGAHTAERSRAHYYTLSTYFGKKYVDRIIEKAAREFTEAKQKKNKLYTYESYWDFRDLPAKTLGNVISNKKEEIVRLIEEFRNSKEWYAKRGIPYKTGFLLHGPPGTGKTSLVKALANHFKLDIYVLGEKQMSSASYLTKAARGISKGIILIEDVDSLFPTRDKKDKEVNISTLLNFLDGVVELEDNIVILTTNDLKAIDPAIYRPGRIDHLVKLDLATSEEVSDYLRMFYEDKSFMTEVSGVPLADVQKDCLSLSKLEVYKKYDITNH